MGTRARFYVMVAMGVVAVLVLGRIGDDWGEAAFYGACAGVVALGSTIGLLWVEMARDGALGRRPRS